MKLKNNKAQKPMPPKRTPKHASRYIAARGLEEVLEKEIPLDQALTGQALFTQLEPRDRAFAHLIAATALRRLGQIDKVLSPFIKKEPPSYVMSVLRTGAAQILFLGTAPHAAVDGAVTLLKRSKKTMRAAGMANAVLRRVSEQGEALLAKTQTLDNIPDWLAESWSDSYGEESARAMADMLAQDPPLDISAKGSPQNWAEKLDAQLLPGDTIRREKIGNVPSLAGFDEGAWWVQDISASLPVKLLGDVKGKRVLDMCAAPGGKTLQLAALGADVTALDKNKVRLERVSENLNRTGLKATIAAGNAQDWRDPQNPNGGGFDMVLLDAPCTATGTYRRRPDVLHLKTPENVVSLMRVQEKLLSSAAKHVKTGGTLIYCTCSLEAGEGEAQVAKFTKNRSDFRLNSILSSEVFSLSRSITEAGYMRILPHFLREKGGMDGFFIARFTRC